MFIVDACEVFNIWSQHGMYYSINLNSIDNCLKVSTGPQVCSNWLNYPNCLHPTPPDLDRLILSQIYTLILQNTVVIIRFIRIMRLEIPWKLQDLSDKKLRLRDIMQRVFQQIFEIAVVLYRYDSCRLFSDKNRETIEETFNCLCDSCFCILNDHTRFC